MVSSLRWVFLGVGVALAVAGGVTLGSGISDHNQIENLEGYGQSDKLLDMTRVEAMDLRDSGSTKKTIGIALLGTGGAALVTSVVLFLIPSQKERPAPTVTLSVGPDGQPGAQLMLQGKF